MIANARLRVLAYDGGPFDVELNFDLDEQRDLPRADLQRDLRIYVTCLAAKHDIARFFAGLEPAVDEHTRLFTGDEVGPYSIA
ncbi:MAG: hypothetical protein AAFQ65_01560 [Myxococcota bacterium]